jgi:hypothetical protein
MRSVMGFLTLLFSATTALANDYQIFPSEYFETAPFDATHITFIALVVDVTSGLMHACNGTLDTTGPKVSVACFPPKLHGVTAMPAGPAALSPAQNNPPPPAVPAVHPGFLLYPGLWKASAGVVIFCSDPDQSGGLSDFYCATTNLPQ